MRRPRPALPPAPPGSRAAARATIPAPRRPSGGRGASPPSPWVARLHGARRGATGAAVLRQRHRWAWALCDPARNGAAGPPPPSTSCTQRR
jgi:hypothetical protein